MVVTGRGQGMPPCLFLGGIAVRLPQGPVWWGLPCPALCQPFIFHQSEMHWVQSVKWEHRHRSSSLSNISCEEAEEAGKPMWLTLQGFCFSTGCQMCENTDGSCPGVSWVLFLLPANAVPKDPTSLLLWSASLGSKPRTPQCLEWGHLHTWLLLSTESCWGFTGRAAMETRALTSHPQDQQGSNSWLRCLEARFPLNSTARI